MRQVGLWAELKGAMIVVRVLTLVFAVYPLISCNGSREPESSPASLVKELLKLSAKDDPQHKSRFFAVVSELAIKQGMEPADLIRYQGATRKGDGSKTLANGTAVLIELGKQRYIVVILGTQAVGRPGLEAQQLILMDEGGKYLDKIACEISSRYGSLRTDVKTKPEEDKAQLVIRLIPAMEGSSWHNWHIITYNRKAFKYHEKFPADDEINRPTEWSKKGLCRIAISDGKFVSVFPKLENLDEGN